MRFVVTDLTKFRKGNVCLAGIEEGSLRCIRPTDPYLTTTEITAHQIKAGSILDLDLTVTQVTAPHVEDMKRRIARIVVDGMATGPQFKKVLKGTTKPSINAGFDGKIPPGEKYAPYSPPPTQSIVTIAVPPENVQIVRDGFKPGEIKINVHDGDRQYRYLPMRDLGFYSYIRPLQANAETIEKLNTFIHNQDEVFLRIGLGRAFESGGKYGYWLQVNGLYTYPEYMEEVRTYLIPEE